MNTTLCRCGFGQDPGVVFGPAEEIAFGPAEEALAVDWSAVDWSASSSWVGDWSGDWSDAPGFIDTGASWSFWDSAFGKFTQDLGTKVAVATATAAITGALAPAGSAAAAAQQRAAGQAALNALNPYGPGGAGAAYRSATQTGAAQTGTFAGMQVQPTPAWVWPVTIGGVALAALLLFTGKGKRR